MSYNDFLEPLISSISYPSAKLLNSSQQLIEICGAEEQEIKNTLKEFKFYIENESLETLKENFINTFDLKAMACLDIGYVLFGEDYKRGAFLVEIQRLQKQFGVDTGTELPDHLPNFLKLLIKLPENEEKKELVEKILMPALSKILESFERERNTKNYYRFPLLALKMLTEKEFKMNDTVLKGVYL